MSPSSSCRGLSHIQSTSPNSAWQPRTSQLPALPKQWCIIYTVYIMLVSSLLSASLLSLLPLPSPPFLSLFLAYVLIIYCESQQKRIAAKPVLAGMPGAGRAGCRREHKSLQASLEDAVWTQRHGARPGWRQRPLHPAGGAANHFCSHLKFQA